MADTDSVKEKSRERSRSVARATLPVKPGEGYKNDKQKIKGMEIAWKKQKRMNKVRDKGERGEEKKRKEEKKKALVINIRTYHHIFLCCLFFSPPSFFRHQMAKAGEADRVIPNKMPKHLFSGKRGMGKTDRR